MIPEEWQRIRPILESALELGPGERREFLESTCPEPALRQEVDSLLAAHDAAAGNKLSAVDLSNFVAAEEAQFRLMSGKRIGAYEIVDEIALGGMGAVYRAIRADGEYQKFVAVKILRAELGAEFTTARFRNERQILATLDHPNIAKILDAGTTTEGLPFFVMELVDGMPITDYCSEHHLPIEDRIRIFRTVCEAVHYAHQRLIIHRDLKPGNIFVSTDGVVKLLDFGIAKVLDPSLVPEASAVTAGGLWLMTPEYASPEQLRGEPITTAADIYSLGLVLYELLAGVPAYTFPNRMPHEIARIVLEGNPVRPSAAVLPKRQLTKTGVESIQSPPVASSDKLGRRIAGDLDNIVMKAISKNPWERYNSPDQFSEDLRRHLGGLPVLAREHTLAYRCGKYVERHRVGVVVTALVFVALLAGLLVTLHETYVARKNQRLAEERFNDVRRLTGSLIFELHDSIRTLPGATSARKLLLQRAQEYLDRLASEPGADASLLRELASAYSRLSSVQGDPRDANLGNSQLAVQNQRHAVQLRERVVGMDPANPEVRRELAESYLGLTGSVEDPHKDYIQKAITILEQLAASNPADRKVQYYLAKALEQKGQSVSPSSKPDEALQYFRKSLQMYQKLGDADPNNATYKTEISFAHKHVGGLLILQHQFDAALEEYRAALAIDQKLIDAAPQNANARYAITFTYSDMGYILGAKGDVDGALAQYNKAFEIRSELAQADPSDTRARGGLANTYVYLGSLVMRKGRLTEALQDYKKALSIRQALWESDPGNQYKRQRVAHSLGAVGQAYVTLASQPNVTMSQRSNYCRLATTWIQKALPEIVATNSISIGNDRNYDDELRKELQHCGQR